MWQVQGRGAALGGALGCLWLCGSSGCGGLPADKGPAGSEQSGQGSSSTVASNTSGGASQSSGASSGSNASGSTSATGSNASSAAGTTPTTIALTGCPSSGYAAPFTIGAQQFDLIVDTGSGDLAVASSNCSQCTIPSMNGGASTPVTPVYMPGSTATDLMSTVQAQYALGQWTGELYQDTVSLKGVNAQTTLKLAAIQTQSQFFTASGCNFGAVAFQPEGIAGFGPDDLATMQEQVFVNRLAAQMAVPHVFAVELCPIGGQLWVGGYDAQKAQVTGDVHYTPLTASHYYSIGLGDMALGGTSLGFGATDFRTSIVDTGSTGIVLPTAIFNTLVQTIGNNQTFAGGFPGSTSGWLAGANCFQSKYTSAQLDAMLPGLSLTLPDANGGTFQISLTATESYLAPSGDGTGNTYYCAGILENTAAAGVGTILGVASMSAHLVIFDVANSRIGFATQSFCN